MFNANKPNDADLPTAGQLIRSTFIALAAAIVILVTIVLPSEYAIDPTGVGRALGLTSMGQIKQQLAKEAHADEMAEAAAPVANAPATITETQPPAEATNEPGPVEQAAPAPEAMPVVAPDAAALKPEGKSDEVSFSLKPAQGAEFKLTMNKGAKVAYSWEASGGVVNYDLHATAKTGAETSYRKGRDVGADNGEIVAAFDGAHGWFWRNRGTQDVTIVVKTSGDYAELKRVK